MPENTYAENPPIVRTALLGLAELELVLSMAYSRGAIAGMRWSRDPLGESQAIDSGWLKLVQDARGWGYDLPGTAASISPRSDAPGDTRA